MPDPVIDQRLDRIARQPFRRKFRLRLHERAMAETRGLATMRVHAAEITAKRLAPATPHNDGKQTPYRGHPVFVAQHATATCCRTCLERWHDIPKGRQLDSEQRRYVVDVIVRWIERELTASRVAPGN
jgi:Domain of unknown function (DUF4186)